jgi:hypothetical protein
MSPSPEHERLKHVVALFVEVVAEELSINVEGLGLTTFRREDLQRGFGSDACFYVLNAGRIRFSQRQSPGKSRPGAVDWARP